MPRTARKDHSLKHAHPGLQQAGKRKSSLTGPFLNRWKCPLHAPTSLPYAPATLIGLEPVAGLVQLWPCSVLQKSVGASVELRERAVGVVLKKPGWRVEPAMTDLRDGGVSSLRARPAVPVGFVTAGPTRSPGSPALHPSTGTSEVLNEPGWRVRPAMSYTRQARHYRGRDARLANPHSLITTIRWMASPACNSKV